MEQLFSADHDGFAALAALQVTVQTAEIDPAVQAGQSVLEGAAGANSDGDVAWVVWIVMIMVFSAVLGGYVNYLRERQGQGVIENAPDQPETPDEAPPPSLRLHVGLSMIAVLLTPLFLGITQSDLLDRKKGAETDPVLDLLIFMGFCLVAAVTSVNFINAVTQRVVDKLDDVEQTARKALDQARKTDDQFDEDAPDDATAPPVGAAGAPSAPPVDMSDDDKLVLSALALKPQLRRSVSGVTADAVGMNPARALSKVDTLASLGALERAGFITVSQSRKDGLPRYKLSAQGAVELHRSKG